LNDNQPTLAEAVQSLARAIQTGTLNTAPSQVGKSKVREPEPFDGTSLAKLCTFLVQCQLNFQDHPSTFPTKVSKVTYTLLYLRGSALDWFELYLLNPELQNKDFLMNYQCFKQELEFNFRVHNPEGNVENKLEVLQMKDNQCIVKYLLTFNHL
jgi:hypothetical protein